MYFSLRTSKRTACERTCVALGLALVGLAGCAGATAQQSRYYGTSLHETPQPVNGPEPVAHAATASVPDDIVEQAALPFVGYRTAEKTRLSQRQLWDALIRADAVCVGESHANPHHHYAEWRVLEELALRAPMNARKLGLGLEMFQQPFQYVLDAYAQGLLDEEQFLEQSEYEARWGYPFAYYRPLFVTSERETIDILALNASRELTRGVAKAGLEDLKPELRNELEELELVVDDAEHRAQFDALMEGHPHSGADPDNMYLAQVIWDESMAEAAAEWLREEHPMRLVVIVAGSAHCHQSAIPRRIHRRTGARVVSLKPLVELPDSDIEAELAGYDYGILMQAGSESPH